MDAALAEAIDGLLAADVSSLADDELESAVHRLMVESARLGAARARVVGEWQARGLWSSDGSKSARAGLAHRCGVSGAAAGVECRRARKLAVMPLVAAALARGEIGLDQVDVFCAARSGGRAELFARDEEMLVGHAKELSFRSFERAVRYWRCCADSAGEEDRARRCHERRFVALSSSWEGGYVLSGALGALDGAVVEEELRRVEQELFEADWVEARGRRGPDACAADLRRTSAQRRADALVEMARRSAALPDSARAARPLITVLVGYEQFAGPVCELANGMVVTPGAVAALIGEADIERVVFDGPSRVIDVGVRQRFFTGALRRAIEVRDRHCTHPGCHVPAEQCEVDHIVEHSAGGLTTQDNGRLLCPRHNRRRPGRARPP